MCQHSYASSGFKHGLFPSHDLQVTENAKEIGFPKISKPPFVDTCDGMGMKNTRHGALKGDFNTYHNC